MKNIHVLPTDKPSRLFDFMTALVLLKKASPNDSGTNQHIYITTDEDIKPNTYCLINGVLCKTEIREGKIVSRQLTGGATMDICKSEYLEIILTTDKDLIGVQAIDDEFLEWFVNNPNCEEVDVTDWMDTNGNIAFGGDVRYQISSSTYNKIISPKEKPTIFEEAKQRAANYMSLKGALETKQKTLEEAAENFAIDKQNDKTSLYYIALESFTEGAKEQEQRMYSYDELRRIAYNAYCFGQLEEPTEGKFNQWIAEFKK